MARFPKLYGDTLHRIESISRIDNELRVLDFKLAELRARVLEGSNDRFAYDNAAVA